MYRYSKKLSSVMLWVSELVLITMHFYKNKTTLNCVRRMVPASSEQRWKVSQDRNLKPSVQEHQTH